MSLNYDFRRIKDHEVVCWEWKSREAAEAEGTSLEELIARTKVGPTPWCFADGKLDEIVRMRIATFNLIFGCLDIRIGEITEKNVGEVCKRLAFRDHVFGIKTGLTRKDVESHVGLHINVKTESRTTWLAGVYKSWSPEVECD